MLIHACDCVCICLYMSVVSELPQVFCFFNLTFHIMILEAQSAGEYVLNHANSFFSFLDLDAVIIIFPTTTVKVTLHTFILVF